MKTIAAFAVLFLVLGGCALADWDDAKGRGLFPFWQTGGDWYTLLTFVNTSEETDDVIHIRFQDVHGTSCSDWPGTMCSIRQTEMLLFSTTQSVPIWIPTASDFGYILFRTEEGGCIQTFCVIYNEATGSGYTVPAYHQDRGF